MSHRGSQISIVGSSGGTSVLIVGLVLFILLINFVVSKNQSNLAITHVLL